MRNFAITQLISDQLHNFNKDEVCIEGAVKIVDSYHDHLYQGEEVRPSDTASKFVFRGSQVEDRVNIRIGDDECITPGREIKVWIDTAYQDRDEYPNETKYGYDIDTHGAYGPGYRRR